MDRLSRMLVASGAGLALALTASPAMAAPPADSGSNRAQVTKVDRSYEDYSQNLHVVSKEGNGHSTRNVRQQQTFSDADGGNAVSFDQKEHSTQTDNVYATRGKTKTTYDGEACRSQYRTVVVGGEVRTQKSRSTC